MKDFLKYTLATLTGIILFMLVVGIICVFSLIGMAASDTATVNVKDNSVFTLKLSGIVQERSSDDMGMLALLSNNEFGSMGLDDILASIEKAKENEAIKGIYIEAGPAEYDSYATAQTIRDALADFKKSGKWIVAYGDEFTQMNYWVASVANELYMNKTGMLDLKGLGRKAEYHTGLYEKLGIKYQAVRVGKYKSYVEMNTRKDMSPEDREQRMAYMQGAWNRMLKDIAESRKLKPEGLNQLVNDSIMAFANPEDYLKAKLIDKMLYPDELKQLMKKKLGLADDEDVSQALLTDMINVKSTKKNDGEQVAVYYAVGEITDEDLSSFTGESGIVGKTMTEDLGKLAADEDVKAVVIRVNSPGGSAFASEQIWHEIQLLRAEKPVVVSMGGMAASGGYYISCGANEIWAEPMTLTGSIGIFGMIPDASELLTDKLGLSFDVVKTNALSDFGAMGRPFNATETALLQGHINRGYELFTGRVAGGRGLEQDSVKVIAEGRVWTGEQAQKIGLVDKLGNLDDAIASAAKLAELEDYTVGSYPAPEPWYMGLLDKSADDYMQGKIRAALGEFYPAVSLVRRIGKMDPVQARLPFDPNIK